jgi:hypothetical protein
MSIQTTWSEREPHTILMTIESGFEWEMLYAAFDDMARLASETSEPCAMILDMRQFQKVPANAITHAKNTLNRYPENVSLVVLVGMNYFINTMWSVFQKLFANVFAKRAYHAVATLDEAYLLVERMRANASSR